MTRRTAIIIASMVIIAAILILVYLIFFNDGPTDSTFTPVTDTPGEGTGFFPVVDDPALGSPSDPTTNIFPNDPTGVVTKLRQITNEPVAGFIVFERETLSDGFLNGTTTEVTSTETVIRYIERATGHIFEAKSTEIGVRRITNTTIPKIQEAHFYENGAGVVVRYLNDDNVIETFAADVVSQSTSTTVIGDDSEVGDLKGIFLPSGIDSLVKSSSDDTFFYLTNGEGYTFPATAPQEQTNIFSSPATEWEISWTSDDIIISTTPSYTYDGLVYTLNPISGSFSEIINDGSGLSAIMNPAGSYVVFSEIINGDVNTGIYDTETKELSALSINTLAEKCVWSKNTEATFYCAVPKSLNGDLPDKWYQGLTSFNDKLVKANLFTDTIDDISGVTEDFDMTKLQISENEDFIVFVNKKDLSLWSIDLID